MVQIQGCQAASTALISFASTIINNWFSIDFRVRGDVRHRSRRMIDVHRRCFRRVEEPYNELL
jgi:hypothetical protein